MTQKYTTLFAESRGEIGATGRRILSTSRSPLSGRPRTSPNRCGLFSRTKPDADPAPADLDLDDDALLSLINPKMESQISVLSTDSGILPSDIRNSSFVDDVIGELTSQGICHTDIISEPSEAEAPVVVAIPASPVESRKRKASSPLELPVLSPNSISPDDHSTQQDQIYSRSSNVEDLKRIKNNEASRKSRANRKYKNGLKEEEIATLEEENFRLSVLLKDFSQVAATCKRWLVQKMENPAKV
ncbi:hypothetical protein BOX15_Mlig007130g1 [Macrostomum lignano]|uniref:BZIP domain-containing protein n=1 Tax=Macrostomum lignano TaxID=282301 RepID=A0A267E2W1_9PLAT|nr:hypothetical protein BOX15_Mlig007130g1 [Macrostomum lignano]